MPIRSHGDQKEIPSIRLACGHRTRASRFRFGLFIGKPVGIFIFSLLACLLRIAELPAGSNWKQLWSIGMIGGIGFTMSIFIDSLAFTDQSAIDMGKIAIILTSVVVSVVGLVVVSLTCRKRISNK